MKISNFKFQISNFRKRPACRQAGFTLVELLIYMGIFSILLTVLTSIFVAIVEVRLESEATSSVEQDGRFILSRFIYDINNAQSIVTPSTLGQTTNTLQITKDGINYTYALNAGNLELTDNNGSDMLNGYNTTIANLTFKRLGNTNGKNSIMINFTIASKTVRKEGPETKDIQTTIGIR